MSNRIGQKATRPRWRRANAFITVCLLLSIAALSSCRKPIPSAGDSEAIAGVVTAFHDALAKGDRAAAMSFLALDAQIVESGHHQTREEYEREHLGADIEFAQAVPSTRSDVRVEIDGDTAWLTSRSRTEGEFKGSPINSSGAELIILTKTQDGWRIRAIHWSSHKVTKQ